ncbi:MAG: pyridoxal phosphate-dependent aminotransferase [Phycisphaerales bacterium]
MDFERLFADRTRAIDASGIRRVFEIGARLKDKFDFSIGQPNFPVPDAVKRAAVEAINADRNGYTVTQGIQPLRDRLAQHLKRDLNWNVDPGPPNGHPDVPALLVSPGTSASLVLAFLALIGPGDEAIIPDPYFVLYPHLANLAGGKAVRCDTYPDFKMTAQRVEPLITARTKIVLLNSPGNPSGVVMTQRECADLLDLCRRKNVLLISDEIYDEFTFSDSREGVHPGGRRVCPSPARLPDSLYNTLVVRGFGKTYGVTGWRLGYAVGPSALIAAMTKLQQYTYVCAPHPLQVGAVAALDVDVSANVAEYEQHRDEVVSRLSEVTEVVSPGGAFYAFPRIPAKLGMSGEQFFLRCLDRKVMIVPGSVFSNRDTHFRLSFAVSRQTLRGGLEALVGVLKGQ